MTVGDHGEEMNDLRDGSGIGDFGMLVDHLCRCVAFADERGDHVLAALVTAAHEVAMTRLGQAAIAG